MKNILYTLLALPLFMAAQTTTENYVKTATYVEPTTTSDESKAHISVTYFDAIGRPMQQVSGKASASGKDIITHMEYDQYGRQVKEYLPFATTNSATLIYDPLAKDKTLNFYNTPYYENTPNPYSEKLFEASPLNRVLRQGAPGEPWQVNPNSTTDHTIKSDYQTNRFYEVRRFAVTFDGGNTELPTLECPGWYAANQLYKTVIKDENWTPGSGNNKITEEFKDKTGRIVLSRRFNNDQPHDTYYVYDDYDNLTYVIPPMAVDNIVDTVALIEPEGRNFPWTAMGRVSPALAEAYERAIGDYDNKDILNADLFSEFGGQGGFSLVGDSEGNLNLTINITTLEPMPYRTGVIADLKEVGDFADMEVGRMQGEDYDYFFYIRKNQLMIDGDGKVPSINLSINSGNRPEYQTNYSWALFSDIHPRIARDYENATSGLDNSEILNTYTDNQFGAMGGVAISLDENNTLGVSLNITAAEPLKLRNGAVFPLSIKRPLPDIELGSVSGTDYQYTFRIRNNNLHITGHGAFTTLSFGATRSQNEIYLIVPEALGMCYIYHHDSRNRIIEKHIPDAGWTHMVYDKLDRVVLMQDENLRFTGNARGNWIFTKYDAFNRTVYTGTLLDNRDRQTMQQELNAVSQPVLNESPSDTPFYDDAQIFYTNNAFPTDLANMEIHSVNYYDGYSAGSNALLPPAVYGEQIVTNVKGLPTRSLVRILDEQGWNYTITGYNKKGMPVYTNSTDSFLSIANSIEMKLGFTGNVTESKTTHHRNFQDLVVYDYYTYDHMLRLKNHLQSIGPFSINNLGTMIANNTYDELGQLKTKKVGGQEIDYTYNVRGWLKMVNNPAALGNDLFAFKLNYNTKDIASSTQLYNGNIAETHWKTANDGVLRSYSYRYDDLNRLENANYISAVNTNKYTEGPISYDKNGNIMSLERWGLKSDGVTLDKIDLLSYHYLPYSNRLEKVTDAADPIAGFNNGTTGNGTDYTYDANGNMKKDLNKNIGTAMTDGIDYNHLNLPVMVTISEHSWVKYTYDAAGTKVRKVVSTGQGQTTTTDYAGGYVYENGALKYFPHPEGYASREANGNFIYIYNYKDHLGNVRLSYTRSASGVPQIIEETNYYAFGMQHEGYNIDALSSNPGQKITYNSMEYQDELKLNWYDYMARNYDPSIGRWFNIDPLAEVSRRFSPYTYALNNPVYFIDPDGMMADDFGSASPDLNLNDLESTINAGDFDTMVDLGYGRVMSSRKMSSSVEYSGAGVKMNKSGREKVQNLAEKELYAAGYAPHKDISDEEKPNSYMYNMVQNIDFLRNWHKDAGEPGISYTYSIPGARAHYLPGEKKIEISSLSFQTNLTLFFDLVHEMMHAWDHHRGYLDMFGGWDHPINNFGDFGRVRSATEVRAYQVQMYFGAKLNSKETSLLSAYKGVADEHFSNYQIRSYPKFFEIINNRQK